MTTLGSSTVFSFGGEAIRIGRIGVLDRQNHSSYSRIVTGEVKRISDL
ncbi:unnamed protein product [Arabidopsis lyrata]|nr:unnamed protein product [Arabidopsis lyrata]